MFDTVKPIVLAFATHQSLKACLHLMFLRAVQFWNILVIFVTADVLKLDKSSEVKLLHSSNIVFIFVTAEVSKLDKSSEVKDLQAPNILIIFVTADVLKLDKTSEVKPMQPLNI